MTNVKLCTNVKTVQNLLDNSLKIHQLKINNIKCTPLTYIPPLSFKIPTSLYTKINVYDKPFSSNNIDAVTYRKIMTYVGVIDNINLNPSSYLTYFITNNDGKVKTTFKTP
jgi:hypothetical protein